jgi:hypothetical protein
MELDIKRERQRAAGTNDSGTAAHKEARRDLLDQIFTENC